MKCKRCGKESEGTFCVFCGERIEDDHSEADVSSLHDKLEDPKPDNHIVNDKIPFYLHIWFIILIAIITGCLFCIPAIVLIVLRIKKYPERKKPAIICLCVIGAIAALSVAMVAINFMSSSAKEKAIDNYIMNEDYKSALAYVDDNYDATKYSYYSKKADIYVASGDYDSAAQAIMDYCNSQVNLLSLTSDSESRLLKYKDKVTDSTREEINSLLERIKSEKAEKENDEKEKEELKSETEKAKKEAAEAKAQVKKAEEETKKAKEEAKQAKNDNEVKTDKSEKNNNDTQKKKMVMTKAGGYVTKDGKKAIEVTDIAGSWFTTLYNRTGEYDEVEKSGTAKKQNDGSYRLEYFDGSIINFYYDGSDIYVIDDNGKETQYVHDSTFIASLPDGADGEDQDEFEEGYNNSSETYESVDVDNMLRYPENYIGKHISLKIECGYKLSSSSTEFMGYTSEGQIVIVNKTAGERWLERDILEIHGIFMGIEQYGHATNSDYYVEYPTIEVYESVLIDKK